MSKRKGYCRRSAYKRIAARDGEQCADCGQRPKYWIDLGPIVLDDGSVLTAVEMRVGLELDHIVAIADGGLSVDGNFALRCRPCHQIKTDAEAVARRLAA